jgi:hypothetical protein
MDLTAPTVLYEKSLLVFLIISVVIGGGAAWMTGRAMARGWKPFLIAFFYCILLAWAIRYLHWALFLGKPLEGSLFTVQYYLVDLAILVVFAWLGYRTTRTTQMVSQYHWLYERTSPLTWQAVGQTVDTKSQLVPKN